MKQGVKHLVECHCMLPQYRGAPDPVFHKFVVFSVIDEHDNVIPKNAQCTNCGVIHRVIDIMKSEVLMGNDETNAVLTIDDLKHSIPDRVVRTLESYEVSLPTWEEVIFIIENKQWDKHVILTSEETKIGTQGKLIRFTGPQTFRIEPYTSRNMIG